MMKLGILVMLLASMAFAASSPIGIGSSSTTGLDYVIVVKKPYAENQTIGDIVGYSLNAGASKTLTNKTMYAIVSGFDSGFITSVQKALVTGKVNYTSGNTTYTVVEVKKDFTNWNYTAISTTGLSTVKINGTCLAGDWVIASGNTGYGICKTIGFQTGNLQTLTSLSSYDTASIKAFLTNVINFFTYQQYKVCTSMEDKPSGLGYIVCTLKGT
jgi:hypothetical protein